MSSPTLSLSSPAKINLNLRVLGKRPDGFHAVETRMCPLSLADEVILTKTRSGRTLLTCSDQSLPADETNLALKALRAYEAATGIKSIWHIHLDKRIPHGAGLGGGSSNAAAVLKGVNAFADKPLELRQLSEIAATLGSDIPFFLYDGVCDASGRGEIITPVSTFPWKLPLVLIKPPFNIPTPWAYQQWAASKELQGVLYAPQICPWGEMFNDLERPVFEKWTLLPTLKMWLLEQPQTLAALMSGSGSTLFAVAKSGADAAELAEKVRAQCGPTTWVQVVQTLGAPASAED